MFLTVLSTHLFYKVIYAWVNPEINKFKFELKKLVFGQMLKAMFPTKWIKLYHPGF